MNDGSAPVAAVTCSAPVMRMIRWPVIPPLWTEVRRGPEGSGPIVPVPQPKGQQHICCVCVDGQARQRRFNGVTGTIGLTPGRGVQL